MDDETEIGISRYQLLRLLDPYNKNHSLSTKNNDDLLRNLFDLCMSKKTYRFEDYEIEKRCILEYVNMKEEKIKEREKKLNEREEQLNEKERRLSIPLAREYVRPPIPVVRECLIPVARNETNNIENALYYSQQSQAARYNTDMESKTKEENDIAEAIKRSIEEENSRAVKYIPEECLKPAAIEGPNYEKLKEKTSEFTPEIADKLYILLKQKDFSGFKNELANVPLQISSCIWKLTGPDGSTLKQLFLRQGDAYKCLE